MLHCLWRQYKWCWQTVCAFCPYNACIKPCQHTCHKRSLMLVNVYESTVIDLKIPCCLFVPMSRWVIIKYLFVSWNTCRGSNIVNIKPLLWTKCQKKKKKKSKVMVCQCHLGVFSVHVISHLSNLIFWYKCTEWQKERQQDVISHSLLTPL